ncbi:hypothetical protein BGY98DRAFT_962113 [Russula aff. rugulosa BPL654]|jgi:hypothetical protein|nr:hypothetical protein BGY98DRAFT_962113 [Russula aff. rugulosa BPL654]
MVTIRNKETSLNLNASMVASKSVKSMSNTVRQVRARPAFVLRTVRLVISGNPEAAAGEEMLQYRYRSTRLCVSISPPKKAMPSPLEYPPELLSLICAYAYVASVPTPESCFFLGSSVPPRSRNTVRGRTGGRRSRYVFPAVGSLSSKAGKPPRLQKTPSTVE